MQTNGLLAKLTDPDKETRVAALEQLALRMDDEIAQALLDIALIRRRAFEVLVRDPKPWQSGEIRKHFGSADPDWRLTAVFAMGYVKGFEREIAETVRAADGALLLEAVIAAGNMSVSRAASHIRTLATSREEDLDLRLAAIEALPHVDPDCFDMLDDLTRSQNPEIVEAAEYALEELGIFDDTGDDELEEEDD